MTKTLSRSTSPLLITVIFKTGWPVIGSVVTSTSTIKLGLVGTTGLLTSTVALEVKLSDSRVFSRVPALVALKTT